MQCKCGFENAADARFCGNCRLALGSGLGNAVPNAAVSSTALPVAVGGVRAAARPFSRGRVAIAAAVVVFAAAGYWWMNRPPGRYRPDNGGLYPINVNGKYGFMDRSGKTVIAPQFDATYGFSEGLGSVKIGTKWGYINTKGVVAITPQFDDVRDFRYGRATVKLCCGIWYQANANNRYGVIDRDGKYVSSPSFLWVGLWFSGDFVPVKTADGKVAFVNQSGKVAISGNFDGLPTVGGGFIDGLAPAGTGGKWGYIDTTGKWVIDPQFESAWSFADGLAPVLVGGRWGYVDQKGRFVINPQYDFGGEFVEGLAIFMSSGRKMGFIDTKGHVVSDARFLGVDNFSEGLAPVKTEDGWGFIDRTGKMVVSPQFDSAGIFQNGLARVTALGKEAYITTTGAFVVDPFPGTNVRAEKARLAAEAAQAAKANAANLALGWQGDWQEFSVEADGTFVKDKVRYEWVGGRADLPKKAGCWAFYDGVTSKSDWALSFKRAKADVESQKNLAQLSDERFQRVALVCSEGNGKEIPIGGDCIHSGYFYDKGFIFEPITCQFGLEFQIQLRKIMKK